MASPEAPRLSGTFGATDCLASTDRQNELTFGNGAVVTPEGDWRSHELQVVNHPSGTTAILYGGCLADQQEARRALDQALSTHDPTELTRLPGSYTALLHEPDKLTVLGDLVGQYPFFYRRNGQGQGQGLAFASTTQPLRDSMPSPVPDVHTAAARIAIPEPTELLVGRSATADISRLEAGHALVITRGGGVHIEPYETFENPSVNTIEEAAEAFREAILEAVRCYARLGYRLSIDYSGGRDSTSAAYCLAREVAGPLLAVTRYSPDAPNDDLEYARRFLRLPESAGLFDAKELARPAIEMIYADLLHSPVGDEPNPSIVHRSRDRDYYRFLRAYGSELHITGAGADTILDLEPTLYLNGLAHVRTLGKFILSTIEAARSDFDSPIGLAQEVRARGKIDPATHLRLLSQILEGGHAPELLRHGGRIFGSEVDPYWLTPTARRNLADLALARADEVTVADDYEQGNYQTYLRIRDHGSALHGAMQYAAEFGLRKSAIYLNNAVLRACLSIPAHLRVNPWTFKEILGRAMAGLVPKEVTNRSTKGNYSAHGLAGLQRIGPELEYLARTSRLADLGVVEPGAIMNTLERVRMGGTIPWLSLDQFMAWELKLRSLDGDDGFLNRGGARSSGKPATTEQVPTLPDESVYSMTKNVLLVTRSNGAVALNLPRGTYHTLNVDAVRVVRALQEGGNLGAALTLLGDLYPSVAREEIENGAYRAIHKLLAQGILTEGEGTYSVVEGDPAEGYLASDMTRQNRELPKARLRDYPPALGGLAIGLALRRLPFSRQVDILSKLHSKRWSRGWESEVNAGYLATATQRLLGFWLGRAACLESTMGVVLAGALKRRRIDLGLYVRTNPDKFHAAPEVRGVPIRTARDVEVAGVFMPIFRA